MVSGLFGAPDDVNLLVSPLGDGSNGPETGREVVLEAREWGGSWLRGRLEPALSSLPCRALPFN